MSEWCRARRMRLWAANVACMLLGQLRGVDTKADARDHSLEPGDATSEWGISVSVVEYPLSPMFDFMSNSSAWQFAYNPAYLPGRAAAINENRGDGGGTDEIPSNGGHLLVRVQNGTMAPPGVCHKPSSASYIALARVGGKVPAITTFGPANTTFEQTAEDPRVVFDAVAQEYVMTYTANGAGKPPMNRHQGIATAVDPLATGDAGWQRRCSEASPCLPPGFKSGAMLLRPKPPHYMFVYDLTAGCPSNPGGVCRHTVVATSTDRFKWTLANQTLLARRLGMWDAGLIEPGPPPLPLADGKWIFFYNSAEEQNDRKYHVGWAVLAADNPTHVVQRSTEPVLSWTDRPWMIGNSTADHSLCYTPSVVFCNGARALGNNSFKLFFGGADAVVGTATVHAHTTAPSPNLLRPISH